MRQQEVLLTAEDVAELTQTSPETVRRWAREGHLAAVRLPKGRLRFRQADVDALLTTGRQS